MTIDIANIDSVWAEKRTHYSSKGSTSYTYAVSFSLRHTDPLEQKLADWSDQVRAEDFKTWLSKELSLQPTARTA
jgi:hypothetical protein